MTNKMKVMGHNHTYNPSKIRAVCLFILRSSEHSFSGEEEELRIYFLLTLKVMGKIVNNLFDKFVRNVRWMDE